MDANTQAAQAAAAVAVPTWVFIVAGVVLGLVTLFLIVRKIEVSTGHALLIGAAVALFALPFVAKFEWSKDGVKYEARLQAIQVAKSVEEVARAQQQQNETVKQLTAEVQIAAQNIEAFRNSAASGSIGNISSIPKLDPEVIKKLMERSTIIDNANRDAIDRLMDLPAGSQHSELSRMKSRISVVSAQGFEPWTY